MLFVLIGGLLIASVLVLCVKKSQETFYLLGMCGSLLLQFSGILIFIAKKGGYSPELLDFLFFSMKFKSWAQYLYITLAQLGYLIALGRFLFPLFLLELAMSYSMLPALRRRPGLKWAACVLPAASLVVELNRRIVPQGEWATTSIVAGDRLELLSFVGGG